MNENAQFYTPSGSLAGSAAYAMQHGGRQAFYGGAMMQLLPVWPT